MYIFLTYKNLQSIHSASIISFYKIVVLLFLLIFSNPSYSQVEKSYDDVSVTLNVHRLGNVEMQAIIQGQSAFLPVKEVFDLLKIKNFPSADYDSISGFIINKQSSFSINKSTDRIVFKSKVYNLKPTDIIKTEENLYLKSELFGEVFSLDCIFEFRSLSILMKARIDVPAILEMQQSQMRQNIGSIRGEKKADTIIKRKNPLLSLGMADWSVHSMKELKGITHTRINGGIGANIAGGEAVAYLNYNSDAPFDQQQQFYRWRFVNNDKKVLRQVTLGNVFTQTIATIDAQINGFQLTNSPSIYKRSFGTYTISNKTNPEWTVELYINNVLVNYTKADASGFFSFEVPAAYGRSIIRLRHISPYGEERIVEDHVNIPYNFLPANEFEYMITAGIVSNEERSRFSKVNINYGLNNRITIGAGMEYLSSVEEKKMPFVNASVRVGSNIVVSGEHSYKIRSKGIITYKLPSNLQLDVSYMKFDPLQTAINSSYSEEKKAVLSVPFRYKKFSSLSRVTLNQTTFLKERITNAEILFSGMFSGVNANFTTSGVYTSSNLPYVFSNLSLTFRMPHGIRLSPQLQYEYRSNQVSMIKCEAEKPIFKNGFVNLAYEKFFASKNEIIGVGFRYNFSAAQTLFAVRQSRNQTLLTQSARGSLLYDKNAKSLRLSNQNSVGRGGLNLKAFLDLNNNGKRDNNEPAAPGLKFNINGGRVKHNKKDTSISISNLESYARYFIEINKNSFDNIAWQIRKSILSVTVEPNHFKEIEIAVSVAGEISGMVQIKDEKSLRGQGRMIVNIFNNNGTLVAKCLTEPDGYYNYIGLPPGLYKVSIDNAQLTKLKLTTSTTGLPFTIKTNAEGDVVNGLNMILQASR